MTIKLKSLLEENSILVPRNIDSRLEKRNRIDLQRIQEYIKKGSIGDLDLEGTLLTKLPDNLTRVGGDLIATDSDIEDLNNLEYISGGLYMEDSKLKSLPPKLTRINKRLCLIDSPLKNLNNLEYVGGDVFIDGTDISELPEGLDIKGCLAILGTPLQQRFYTKIIFRKYLEERNIKVGGAIYP